MKFSFDVDDIAEYGVLNHTIRKNPEGENVYLYVGANMVRPKKKRGMIAGKQAKSTCYRRADDIRPYGMITNLSG